MLSNQLLNELIERLDYKKDYSLGIKMLKNTLLAMDLMSAWADKGLINATIKDDTFVVLADVFKLSDVKEVTEWLWEHKDLIEKLRGPYGWTIYKAWLAKQEGK